MFMPGLIGQDPASSRALAMGDVAAQTPHTNNALNTKTNSIN
jgi:hypothetical protein